MQLYIPLCLYFNSGTTISVRRFSSFTFHYVSILMNSLSDHRAPVECLYIPLCLYFNESFLPCIDKIIDFTFHYVSILISITVDMPSA